MTLCNFTDFNLVANPIVRNLNSSFVILHFFLHVTKYTVKILDDKTEMRIFTAVLNKALQIS